MLNNLINIVVTLPVLSCLLCLPFMNYTFRRPSLIRELTKVLASAPPEMIPLSGGYPNPAMFPFAKATIESVDGHSFVLEGPALQKALQYLPTPGLPTLVSWLKTLQAEVHNPPLETDLVVTCGSQDGLCKAIEMLLEPEGTVVVEDYVYSGTLAIMVSESASLFYLFFISMHLKVGSNFQGHF